MIKLGVCQVPYVAHGWLPPQPTLASWKALRALGVTDLRLQFYSSLLPRVGLFGLWARPAHAAGLRINANVIYGGAAGYGAFVLVEKFGDIIDSYGIGNEPGFGPWMDDDISRDGSTDYIRDVYFPEFVVPVHSGIRAANPNAVISGFEADSPAIQRRCMEAAKELGVRIDIETAHPYGDVEGGDYATLAKFDKERAERIGAFRSTIGNATFNLTPWLIGEIDHQQFATAIARGEKRGIATAGEIDRLADFARMVQRNYPDCGAIYFGTPEYFFTRELVPNPMKLLPEGTTWSTWTYNTPVVSEAGKRLAKVLVKAKRRAARG